MSFAAHLLAQPLWVVVWVSWLGTMNAASIFFLRHREARWVLAAFASAAIFVHVLFAVNGFNRLLGLAHLVFWTPLLVYLWNALGRIAATSGYGVWLRLLFASNAISLLFDFTDVVRYLLGER